MSVEQELIKVSKFKGEDEGDRQDYLIKLRMHADTISDAKWKGLSDEAKDWLDAAADATENKRELPDFEDAEEVVDFGQAPSPDDADAEVEDDEGGGSDDETGDSEGDNGDGEVAEEPEPPAKPAKPAKTKPVKEAKNKPTDKKPKADKPKPAPRDYTALSGDKDKFGIVIGTKAHDAAAMFEKGCTMKQIMDKLQSGRFYNLLKRMIAEGHKVEKLEGGVWKLTHKSAKKGK